MTNLGSFDPAVYKYINMRYRVSAGTAGNAQIFFFNTTYTSSNSDASVYSTALISDNAWHTISINMSANTLWATGGNITGWRFDPTNANGVTMDIDFIQLGSGQILGTGATLTVSPTTSTTSFTRE